MKYNFSEWTYKKLSVWMDGGTVTLDYDHNGQTHTIEIVQNASVRYYEEISKIPGRVYVNGELIVKRSILENAIVRRLKKDIDNLQTDLDREILNGKISWIKSNEYLELKPSILILSEERKEYLKNDQNNFLAGK